MDGIKIYLKSDPFSSILILKRRKLDFYFLVKADEGAFEILS
jgi:hypothetical protein